MKEKKYKCGQIYPSGCIIYTGQLPTFLPSSTVSCDANIDEILEKYGEKIDQILEDNNLTGLNPQCLDFIPSTVKIKELHQLEINKICENSTNIQNIQESLSDLGTLPVKIDLGCLESEASPCQSAPDTYTLLSILLLFRSEICALKEEVFGS